MDDALRAALATSQVIDITTTGRRSGAPRRIEIVDHVIDGRIYITGQPRPTTRAWIHNLAADPRLTVHLKNGVQADLPAHARIVTDPEERERVFTWVTQHAWRNQNVEAMQAGSPLIEVTIDELTA